MLGRLLLLFTIVPLVELALLFWIAERTDWLFTIALVIITGIVGASLARHEGLRCWTAARQKMAGNWNAKSKMWEYPGAPMTELAATATSEMIMGGRYLVMRFSGTFQGMPFEGMNITGYDNYKQMYNNLWVDNFGTGFYLSTGTCNPDGSECTDMGFWSDPIHGDYQVRQITRIIDDNTFTMEMYMLEQGKDEFKSMEITYTRK